MAKFILFTIFLISSISHAEDRYSWLCKGKHEIHSSQYKTEFSLTVDLETIKTVDQKKFVEAFIKTTEQSKTPESGFAELVELELLRFEELGSTTYLDVQGQDLPVSESMLTFFTVGLDIPDDGRSIIFSSFVDGVPMDGNCKRRQDLDGLWSEISQDVQLDEKLNLVEENGDPKFGLQYAEETDSIIATTFSIQGSELVGDTAAQVAPLKWAFVDLQTSKTISPWLDGGYENVFVDPNSTIAFSLSLDREEYVSPIIPMFSSTGIALSIKDERVVYIDLNSICESSPDKILNLDTFVTGCI